MPSSRLLALTSSLALVLAAPGWALAGPPGRAGATAAGAAPPPAASRAPAPAAHRPAPHRTVALLSLEIVGQSATELRGVVDRSLTQSFKNAGVQVIAYKEVAAILAPTPELTACTSPSCVSRIAELVGSHELVRAHLVASGASYDLELDSALGRRGAEPGGAHRAALLGVHGR